MDKEHAEAEPLWDRLSEALAGAQPDEQPDDDEPWAKAVTYNDKVYWVRVNVGQPRFVLKPDEARAFAEELSEAADDADEANGAG